MLHLELWCLHKVSTDWIKKAWQKLLFMTSVWAMWIYSWFIFALLILTVFELRLWKQIAFLQVVSVWSMQCQPLHCRQCELSSQGEHGSVTDFIGQGLVLTINQDVKHLEQEQIQLTALQSVLMLCSKAFNFPMGKQNVEWKIRYFQRLANEMC